MSIEKVLYRAEATSSGGREGQSKSSDGVLNLKLSTPRNWAGAAGTAPTPSSCLPAVIPRVFLAL
jgi:osmotically inducible protein OsmC